MDRHDRHVIQMIASVLVLVSGCALSGPPDGRPASAASPAATSPTASEMGVDAIIDEVATASSGRVMQVHSTEIPDDVGASTSASIAAGFDRSAGAFDGEFDFQSDSGEHGPLALWPEGAPIGLRVRVIGDDVWAAQGLAADDRPFRDITPASGRALPVTQLTTIFAIVDLVERASAVEPPEPVAGMSATWRGVVSPVALGDVWQEPGAVGSVTRIAGAIPLEHLEGCFVYEVERSDGGWIRLSLWIDVPRLAANLGEPVPEAIGNRVDTTWSALGEPIDIPVPGQLQNETHSE